MGLARGVVIQPTTFQLPKLQLPFEQMQAQIQGMQQEKDVYDTMKGMTPKFVEGDKPLVQAALGEVSKLVEGVSEGYASGKVSDAMRGIRQAKGVLSEMWKPTGVFGGVQEYYNEYQNALKEVDEFTKGFSDPSYNYVYKRLVQESVKDGSGLDLATGKRRSVSAPNMLKELDVIKEFDTFAEGWKNESDQKVGIQKYGNFYYWVGTTEKVSEDEVRSVWNSYIKSPKIQEHLNIQAKYQTAGLTPEAEQQQRTLLTKEFQSSFNAESERLKIIKEYLDSGKQEKIKLAQAQLGVTADGIVGEKTKKALEDSENNIIESKNEIVKRLDELDTTTLTKLQLEKTMENSVVKRYAFTKEDGKLVQRADQLAYLRASQAKSLIDYQYSLQGQPETPYFGSSSVQSLNLEGITKQLGENSKLYSDTYNSLFKSNPVLAQYIKSNSGSMRYGEFAPLLLDALKESQLPNGQYNNEVFKQKLKQYGIDNLGKNKSYSGTTFGLDKLVKALNNQELQVQDLEVFNTRLQAPYALMQDNKAMLGSLSNKLLENVDVNKLQVVKEVVVDQTSDGGVKRTRYYTPEEVRQKLKSGDLEVTKRVAETISPTELQGYIVTSKAYSFGGGVAKAYDTKMLQQMQADPRSLLTVIAPDQLTKINNETAKQLGLSRQKDGQYTIDSTLKITNVGVATTQLNGTTQSVLTLSYTRTDSKGREIPATVTLNDVALNSQFLRTRNLGIAASYLNREGAVTDEGAFRNIAADVFDIDNDMHVAYNANHLANLARSGQFKTYPTTVVMPNLNGSSKLTSGLFKGDDGKVYHVYGRDGAGAFVAAASNSTTTLNQLLTTQDPMFKNNIVMTPVGTIKGDKVDVDDGKLNDSIFDMKSSLNSLNVKVGAMKMLNSKQVPIRNAGGSSSSSISVPMSLLNDDGVDE